MDPEIFARGGPTPTMFVCYFDEGREDSNSTKRGPSSNAGSVALWFFRLSGPVLLINPLFLIKKQQQTLSKLDPL